MQVAYKNWCTFVCASVLLWRNVCLSESLYELLQYARAGGTGSCSSLWVIMAVHCVDICRILQHTVLACNRVPEALAADQGMKRAPDVRVGRLLV